MFTAVRRRFFWNIAFAIVMGAGGRAWAAEGAGLAGGLGNLRPDGTLEVADGTYEATGGWSLKGLRGTEAAPVVIRAAHRGRAVLTGVAGFVLKDCEHVVIEGFVFENDADQQSVRLENCRQVRVTRNVFRPKERAKPRHWEHWVTVEGARSGRNRIDHNLFERKVNRGSPLFIRGDDAALVCSQHDRVDHNHFRDVVDAKGENGHETIRTGGNDLGASGRESFTVIEHNLLERCSGEDEILSLKSSKNIVRGNTLIDCRGAICLRLGNGSEVSGNVIVATGAGVACGGVKLFGFDHRVTGNFFEGLTGRSQEAPLALIPGLHATPTTENLGKNYDDMTATAPTNCVIEKNIWLDCAPLQMGWEKADKEWTHLPKGCVFRENAVLRTRPNPKPLVILGRVTDLRAGDNVAYAPDADARMKMKGAEAWAGWFRWDDELPEVVRPNPLTAADVGPEAE